VRASSFLECFSHCGEGVSITQRDQGGMHTRMCLVLIAVAGFNLPPPSLSSLLVFDFPFAFSLSPLLGGLVFEVGFLFGAIPRDWRGAG